MMFKCKILTDDFLAKVDAYINDYLKDAKDDQEREKIASKKRRYLDYMWNNPTSFVDQPIIVNHFKGLGIFEPKYTEMVFVSRGKGIHLKPRINWLHEEKAISDIKEIFSYELME